VDQRKPSTKKAITVKVWLDVLTPKQAHLFGELQRRLHAKGIRTVLTTREYREVNELLALRNIKSISVGHHGGSQLADKLFESSKRIQALTKVIVDEKPEIAISFSSPEAARVAFGLNIPHYCINDSPHAEAVCKLTIPLSQKLFTPWVVPLYAWKKYGINPRDIVTYRALDPAAWLSDLKPSQKVLDQLGLDPKKPIILVRTPEEFAAYLSGQSVSTMVPEIISKILKSGADHDQIVVLPRYDTQGEKLSKLFSDKIIVPEHVVDAISLLCASTVFIGGGGTMTAEAALLGIPVISYYPGDPTFVEKFLIHYELVERLHDTGRIAQRAIAISQSEDFRDFYKKKSIKLQKSMKDPLKVIIQKIFRN
jgi:predicted glycosyltransferase